MTQAATVRCEPEPSCAAAARRLVADALDAWGLGRFDDDAAVCTSELAANAILHSRSTFTVAVHPIAGGVRIDVQDDRPDLLPVAVPDELDPLEIGTTGRGLKLVAALGARWGYFTTHVAKTVWVELADWAQPGPAEPVVQLIRRARPAGAPEVRIVDLPVRAAIATGRQVDDMVRRLQLDPSHLSEAERATFYQLLDRSAAPRLIGRQEAFRAAGAGQDHYTFVLAVTVAEHAALGKLVRLLGEWSARWPDDAEPVAPEVTAMRMWLPGEVAAQLWGPRPHPLPALRYRPTETPAGPKHRPDRETGQTGRPAGRPGWGPPTAADQARPAMARNSSLVLTWGNGSSGTGRCRPAQIGAHPSAGDQSINRSAGTDARTAALWAS